MDEAILAKHNAVCDDDTIVFFLGDAAFPSKHSSQRDYQVLQNFLNSFKGRIFYLAGNHEDAMRYMNLNWTVLPQLTEITVLDDSAEKGRRNIVMCHYALRTWNKAHYGSWHLYGHSHGGLKNDFGNMMQDYEFTLSMDVGIDCNNYSPFTYEQVKDHMSKKTFRAVDHHAHESKMDFSSRKTRSH